MRKLFVCFFAPLLASILMSMSPQDSLPKVKLRVDSTNTNITFEPARIIVSDTRSTNGVETLIKENSTSNVVVATAIERVVDAYNRSISLQERRCVSYMDRITEQTNLPLSDINNIIRKQRWFDITFYTIFIFLAILTCFKTTTLSAISWDEYVINLLKYSAYIVLYWISYSALLHIFTSPDGQIIRNILNSPPG